MKKNEINKYLGFVNIAFQMGIIIAGGVLLGIWLDGKFPNKYSAFTISLSLLGVFISLYQVYRAVTKMSQEDEENEK
ncbi:Putative F0F1-ATPase subunit Ca2+/Mg2+ transporter [Salegentibacter echinorum]|uniref:Putative F0F1-ATPase subunit Ca2+/Mg2+ transporter n=1 Tax=Salegentibacter echinorum TaxID=1073325 RepID=A0A1M5DUN5_SALEC|nr:AtpZ/AtpI family protein [Salegentibacter echinorum]SHF70758.1 Putative F0F1-ATPase subunit Ca2+/Mg2+ transporter [Salegentibacter echinorum]